MAKVNRALEVLSDPQRRDDYDRTGSDGQTMTVAQEAEDLLMGAMTSVLDVAQGKFIKAVADTLAGMGSKLDAAMSNNAGTRKRLQKRRDAIDCTSERNLTAMIEEWIAHDQARKRREAEQTPDDRLVTGDGRTT